MLFPTIDFALFFIVVFLGHWVLNHDRRAWLAFMIGASYVFYAWANWRYVVLLVAVSAISQVAARAVARREDPRRRARAAARGVAAPMAPRQYLK